MVLINLFAMALETEASLATEFADFFLYLELFSVTFFTLEYLLRLWSITEGVAYESRTRYALSLESLIDLLAILPFYIGFLLDMDLRVFIVFRLFRLFKLFRYFSPLAVMADVLYAEGRSFLAAMLVMLVLLFICATGIYFFEGEMQPEELGSIPRSMWWAIVTLTTLGYGDVVPMTIGGRLFAGVMTIFAIGIVALPAGMLASRFSEELHKRKNDYSEFVSNLLVDGVIDDKDEIKLEQERQKLCLSSSDAELLRQKIIDSKRTTTGTENTEGHCPNCGHPLDS